MIITTTDPVTGEPLQSLASKPFVIEGSGRLAVKIYFESEATRLTYLQQNNGNSRDARNNQPA
ncbi:MAG: hypothetical protein OEY45_00150 [Gammaproteobacteria bacterium]|nr:hypothetical protein [Gammaproteobacteria bacterium]MDH5513553.1 hypothetical protein [Gammaproteobacteria bacterium]